MQSNLVKLAKDYAEAEATNPRGKLAEIIREEAKLKSESDAISTQLRSMEQDMQASVDNKAELVKLRSQLDHLQRWEAVGEGVSALFCPRFCVLCCCGRYRQAVDKRKTIENQIKDVHKQLDVRVEIRLSEQIVCSLCVPWARVCVVHRCRKMS